MQNTYRDLPVSCNTGGGHRAYHTPPKAGVSDVLITYSLAAELHRSGHGRLVLRQQSIFLT